MTDWMLSLVNPSFMPHGHCYLWRPDILWTHVISDVMVATAYYTIPVVLGIFLYKRKAAVPYAGILGLFVAFIFLCGTTHLMAIYVTWYPVYELQGWLKAVTAAVSLLTALALVPKLPELISIPGIKQAYEENERSNVALNEKNREMQVVYNSVIDREDRIVNLKREVNALLNELNQPERYLGDEKDAYNSK